MSNPESKPLKDPYRPTPEGEAFIAALWEKFNDMPLTNSELNAVYLLPQVHWPQGLADKLEALLSE